MGFDFKDKSSAYKRKYYLRHAKGYLEKKEIITTFQFGEIA